MAAPSSERKPLLKANEAAIATWAAAARATRLSHAPHGLAHVT
jgi:hypothetical protein